MSFEIASIRFVQSEVQTVERIDMYAVLVGASMWLILEGFVNGYAATEAAVNRLHVILHDTVQLESTVVAFHSLVQTELANLIN